MWRLESLEIVNLDLPPSLAKGLRQTVLAPFLWLQQQTGLLAAALSSYDAVVAQRDSATLAATFVPELRAENTRLRGLLGLGVRLASGYVPAEVLHEALPTNPLTLIVSAGRRQGCRSGRAPPPCPRRKWSPAGRRPPAR